MKNNNNSIDILKILKTIIGITVLIMIVAPILVNVFMYFSFPTVKDLGNKEWIGFWGSYIGGCFGGFCTLVTIYLTIRYYEKQESEHKTELANQMEKHEEEMKNELLRKYRPLLILRPNGGSGLEEKYNPFSLHVSNLSEYAAINVIVDGVYEPKIDRNTEIVMSIKSVKKDGGYNEFLSVQADDVVGHEYIWKYQLKEIEGIAENNGRKSERYYYKIIETSVYKGYKQDKIEMRGDRAEMSDFPLYLNTVAGGLDRRDQTIGGFSFVVKIYAVPVVEIIG